MKTPFNCSFDSGFYLRSLATALTIYLASASAHAGEHIKTELYFGLSSPSGPVTDSAWEGFVEQYITPAFSEGFTVVDAVGRWSDNGVSLSERSKLLLYYHPNVAGVDEKIESVKAAYISRFDQQAVLRIDVPVGDPVNPRDKFNWREAQTLLLIFGLLLAGTQVYVLVKLRKR